jgi:adenylate cyclase
VDPVSGLAGLLEAAGVAPEEIAAVAPDDHAGLLALAIERLIVPGRERLDRDEVARRVGADHERALDYWRAMGFVEIPAGERAFTEVDADMLGRVLRLIDAGLVDEDLSLQMTRIMGQSLSKIAEAQLDVVSDEVVDADAVMARGQLLAVTGVSGLLDDLEAFLVYMWRRHLAAVAERLVLQAAAGDVHPSVVVGFADLVGFTSATQSMDHHDLAAAVTRFEQTALEVISNVGGRVVKMIGDEVMFAADGCVEGAEIALRLVEAFAADDSLPDVRVGVSRGQVVPHQGDLFGAPVNLASRLVNAAFPASVLVSDDLCEELDERFVCKPVRGLRLKGIGRSRASVLRRPD